MDINIAARMGVLIFAALLSAFLSGAETALFSLRQEDLSEAGRNKLTARIISGLKARPNRLLITIVLSNMVVNLLFFSVSYLLILTHKPALHPFAVPLSGAGALLFVILFCEVIPKNLAVAFTHPFSTISAYPVYILEKALWPILTPLEQLVSFFSALIARTLPEQPQLSEEELQTLVELSEKEGVVEEDIGQMMAEVLELSDIAVKEIAVPRVDMVCFSAHSSPADITLLFRESKHTLLPVYEKSMDNMLGVLHIRDFLFRDINAGIKELVRKIPFLPESASAEDALHNMRLQQTRMVFVVDEYGAVEGLITIEDILEEIVGSIQDEYDAAESPAVQKLSESRYRLRGDLSIREWKEAFAIGDDFEPPAATVGGLVMTLLEKIPAEGDSVTFNNLHFKVESTQGRRIKYIQLKLLSPDNNDQLSSGNNINP